MGLLLVLRLLVDLLTVMGLLLLVVRLGDGLLRNSLLTREVALFNELSTLGRGLLAALLGLDEDFLQAADMVHLVVHLLDLLDDLLVLLDDLLGMLLVLLDDLLDML